MRIQGTQNSQNNFKKEIICRTQISHIPKLTTELQYSREHGTGISIGIEINRVELRDWK